MAVSNEDIVNYLNANPGQSDAQIAAAMQQYGVSTDQMAQATGSNVADIQARYDAATAPTPTFESLYKDVLGRAPDTGGLAYWKEQFGDTIDPNELATFKAAAAPELAVKNAWTTAEQTGDYSHIKDAVTQSGFSGQDITNAFSLTPEQKAIITQKSGYDFTSPTIKDYQGTEYDTKTLMKLAGQLGQNLDPSQLSGGVYGENRANIGFDPNEYERATGMQATPVAQVLLDAARGLAQQGITDLSQLKQGDIKGNVSVREVTDEDGKPTGKYVASWADQYGETQSRELTPEEAARITKTTVDTGEGSYDAMTLVDAITGKGLYYGDKLISNDPSFLHLGETYSGPGYTSYGITYDAQGNPHFKTTGGSSSDLGTFAPIIALGSVVPNPYQAYFQAANAAIQYDQGNTVGAILSGLGAAGTYTGTELADAKAASDTARVADLTSQANTINVARNVVGGLNAIDKGNIAGVFAAGSNLYTGAGGVVPKDLTTAANMASAAQSIKNGDTAGLLDSIGNLTQSSDAKIAASATRLQSAFQSGSPAAIASAFQNFDKVITTTGGKSDIVNTLKSAGLDETTPDLNTLTAPDGTKYTMLEEEDLTQGTQVAGPGGGEPGKFAPGTYTKTATNLFANVEMPDGSTKSVPVLVRPDGSLTPTSGSAADAESVRVLRVDPNRIDPRFLDTRQITVPKTPDEVEALSKVTGKSAGDVSDASVKYEVPKEQTPASMLKYLRGAGFDENFNTYALAHASDPQFIQQLAKELEDTIDDPNLNAVYKELTGSYYPGSKLYNATAPLTPVVQGSLNPWGPVAHVTVDGLTEGAGEVVDTSVDPSSGVKVTTQVNAKTNTETTTKVDPKTGTNTQIITTPDLVTQVVTDTTTNTQTKTVTDLTTNVTTTVNVDLNTGSVTVVPSTVTTGGGNNGGSKDTTTTTITDGGGSKDTTTTTTSVDKTTTTPTDTAKTTGPTGLTKSQASQMAAAFGVPNLANVFYYGKDFSSFEEETDEEGKLKKKKYKPLSVTKAGAELPDIPEESVESKSKSKDNNVLAMLEQILGRGSEAASEKELQNIVKGTK